MAKKTVCDVCETVIKDGANVGIRKPIFTHHFGKQFCIGLDGATTETDPGIAVEVTTTARVNGNSEADLCVACLKRAIAEA